MQMASSVTFRFVAHCLLVHFFVILWVSSANAYDYDNSPSMMRAIRRGFGFKQYGLQTARGFGKRGGPAEGLVPVRDFIFSPYGRLENGGEIPIRYPGPDQPVGEGFGEPSSAVQDLNEKPNGQKIQAIWTIPEGAGGRKSR